MAFSSLYSLIVTRTPRHNNTVSEGMPYYQAAHDTTDSPTVVGNGQTNSIFTSLSSLPAAAGGAGAGVSDFDDQPTILHQNEDANSRYRRWWVRVAVGVVMVSCLVLTIALATSKTTGGRSASLRGGTAPVAAATMAMEEYVLPSCLEDICLCVLIVKGLWS